MRYENVLIHEGVAHDNNPPGPGSGRYPWGSGDRAYQHVDRIEISDTVKLDDLKTTTTARVNGFIDQAGSQPINSQQVKNNADLGKNQVRTPNPSGNGTIPLFKKVRQYPNQGYAWNTSYPEIKRSGIAKIHTEIPKSMGTIFSSTDKTIKELKKYQQGQLDDKARKKLDKKIRKMSDEELEKISKRFVAEYNTINAINNRNKVTVPAGQDRATTMANILGDQVNTAMGVIGMIAAIKKLKGG